LEQLIPFDENKNFNALRFVPKGLIVVDPASMTPAKLKMQSESASTASPENYQGVFLAYIQQRQNKWWNITHHESRNKNTNSDEIKSYNNLKNIIESLLGAQLYRTDEGDAEIFGKPIAQANLSDGQKICLQLAVALHAKEGKLDSTVFLLDELENHLHPSVAIELLKRLRTAAPNAQFWIATHSITLLAYIHSIEPMALWYMKDGAVTHAGRHPERVLESLLGDEERLSQLHAFTGLPAILATTNYAAECLLPPITLPAETRDPQISQIAKILEELSSGKILSILDYGAGKGRLLDGLASINPGTNLSERISYFALDDSAKDKPECLAIISEHFDISESRHFSTESEFFTNQDNNSIDVVIMCNVLHEIPPSDWLELFSEESLIWRALHEDGYLLLVEDQRIPVGEKAHKHGFLVLDTPQVKTLFCITAADKGQFTPHDYNGEGRLKAHLIGKSLLGRITEDTRKNAISELRTAALKQVSAVRKKDYSYANGQAHGFWTQQFANACIFLKEYN